MFAVAGELVSRSTRKVHDSRRIFSGLDKCPPRRLLRRELNRVPHPHRPPHLDRAEQQGEEEQTNDREFDGDSSIIADEPVGATGMVRVARRMSVPLSTTPIIRLIVSSRQLPQSAWKE